MEALRQEVAPVFVEEEGRRTDVVVLGCTHYPLLLPELERAAPWPVRFLDPADAIARQALRVAGLTDTPEEEAATTPMGHAYVTGMAAGWTREELRAVLRREGFALQAPPILAAPTAHPANG